jgi:hypothetical protein
MKNGVSSVQINPLTLEDIIELKEIHRKHYSDEFPFPDFFQKFICHFAVVDSNGTLISGGGIRTILESVIMTDKDLPVKLRREALYKILDASIHISRKVGYDGFHAFIQEGKWGERLLHRHGFQPVTGKALILKV